MENENAMKMKDSDRKGPDAVLTGDRRSFLRASLLAGGALAARSLSRRTSFVAAESNSLLATTKAGKVRGAVEDGIIVFKGVPYGAPPTGALRFMAPLPPAPWTGVRDALQFGDRCPQVSAPSLACVAVLGPTNWRERRLLSLERVDARVARRAPAARHGLVSRGRLHLWQRLRYGL